MFDIYQKLPFRKTDQISVPPEGYGFLKMASLWFPRPSYGEKLCLTVAVMWKSLTTREVVFFFFILISNFISFLRTVSSYFLPFKKNWASISSCFGIVIYVVKIVTLEYIFYKYFSWFDIKFSLWSLCRLFISATKFFQILLENIRDV